MCGCVSSSHLHFKIRQWLKATPLTSIKALADRGPGFLVGHCLLAEGAQEPLWSINTPYVEWKFMTEQMAVQTESIVLALFYTLQINCTENLCIMVKMFRTCVHYCLQAIRLINFSLFSLHELQKVKRTGKNMRWGRKVYSIPCTLLLLLEQPPWSGNMNGMREEHS